MSTSTSPNCECAKNLGIVVAILVILYILFRDDVDAQLHKWTAPGPAAPSAEPALPPVKPALPPSP